MNTTKAFWLGLLGLALHLSLYSQEYSVTGSASYSSLTGNYRPFSTTDGVSNYKHTTLNIYLFRSIDFWWFADQPDLSGNIVDFEPNSDDNPPLGTWQSGTVVDVLLPVELNYFEVQYTTDGNLLKWETLTETNNKGFLIEKSIDGKNFYPLSWVMGHGTRQLPMTYKYQDTQPPTVEILYYRLKQVDYDDSFSFSAIISVKTPQANFFKIYPNLVHKGTATIHVVTGNFGEHLAIRNRQGKLIKSMKLDGQLALDIAVDEFPAGYYFLSIYSAAKRETSMFIIH